MCKYYRLRYICCVREDIIFLGYCNAANLIQTACHNQSATDTARAIAAYDAYQHDGTSRIKAPPTPPQARCRRIPAPARQPASAEMSETSSRRPSEDSDRRGASNNRHESQESGGRGPLSLLEPEPERPSGGDGCRIDFLTLDMPPTDCAVCAPVAMRLKRPNMIQRRF